MAGPLSTSANNGLATPRDFVQSGWDYFRTHGDELLLLSQQAIGQLGNYNLNPIVFDFTFDLTPDYATFVRPEAPVVTDLGTVDVDLPAVPAVEPVSIRDVGDAPVEPDFSGLAYAPPAAPNMPLPTAPADINPVLDPVAIPEAPTFTLPDLPTLYELNLPEPPEFNVPEFAGVRPDFDIEAPDSAFNWQEIAYSSTLLDACKQHLQDMIQGGLGLPPEIETALFDRARNRADMLARKRVQETAEDLGQRGLYEPAPYLARRLDEAREAGRQEAAGHNRDITVYATEKQIESVRWALQQGAALEATLILQNGQINDRALQAAKIGHDIAMAVFNARVTLAGLEVELFKADAAVVRDLIQVEIAKADTYRAQIEAQKAIGEVNEGLIRAYAEKVRSVQALADIYRSQIEGARAANELNTQKLEQSRLKIQVFGSEVEAYKAVQDSYRIQTEGALGNVRVFEAIGNVYGRRVDAYRTKGDAYIAEGQFQLQQQGLRFDGFRAALDGARTLISEQSAAIDARARTFGARAAIYTAEGNVIAAESAARDRTTSMRIEAARAKVETAAKGTELRINQNNMIGTLYVEQLKARSTVLSQLTSSLYSGMNFGASYGGSLGVGYSYGKSFGYSGDTDDLNPNF